MWFDVQNGDRSKAESKTATCAKQCLFWLFPPSPSLSSERRQFRHWWQQNDCHILRQEEYEIRAAERSLLAVLPCKGKMGRLDLGRAKQGYSNGNLNHPCYCLMYANCFVFAYRDETGIFFRIKRSWCASFVLWWQLLQQQICCIPFFATLLDDEMQANGMNDHRISNKGRKTRTAWTWWANEQIGSKQTRTLGSAFLVSWR